MKSYLIYNLYNVIVIESSGIAKGRRRPTLLAPEEGERIMEFGMGGRGVAGWRAGGGRRRARPHEEGGRMDVGALQDRVQRAAREEEEVKKGGISIPDTAKEKPQEGKVIAVGNGKVTDEGKKIPLDVKAGDKILFGKYSGSEVKIDDKEYLIMREDDVLAILE